MAMSETELERMVVRLLGDGTSYMKMMEQAQAQARMTASSVEASGKRIESISGAISTFASSATAALNSISESAVGLKSFSDFDRAMTESTAIMQVTEQQTDRLKKTAMELSGASTQSAKTLAQGYFYLASAGLNAEQVIAALPAVTRFATAGNFDLSTATTLAADAQSSLGLKVKDPIKNLENLTHITDILTKANILANGTVRDFSEALTNQAGPSLKAFSKDAEEGVAVLAAMADQGIKGVLAGSMLGRAMRLLSNSVIEHGQAQKRMGFEIFDETGKMRNLADIIENLEKIFEGMSDQARAVTLETFGFEARMQSAIIPIIGTSKAIRQYEKELRSAKGATEEVANKTLTSFYAQMQMLRNQITLVAIDVGSYFAPAFVTIASILRSGIEAWRSMSDAVKQTTVVVAIMLGVMAGIGPAMVVLRPLGGLIASGLAPLTLLLPNLLRTIANPLRLIVLWFNPVFVVFRNLAAVAAAAIVAIQRAGGISDAWYKLEEALFGVLEWLEPIKDALLELGGETIKVVIESFIVMGEVMIDTFKYISGMISIDWESVQTGIIVGIRAITMVVANSREIIGSAFQVLTKYALMFWGALTKAGEGASDWIGPLVDGLTTIRDVAISFLVGLAAGAYGVFTVLVNIGTVGIEAITGLAKSATSASNSFTDWGVTAKIVAGITGALVVVIYSLTLAYKLLMIQQIASLAVWVTSKIIAGAVIIYNAVAASVMGVIIVMAILVPAIASVITAIASFNIAGILATAANVALNVSIIALQVSMAALAFIIANPVAALGFMAIAIVTVVVAIKALIGAFTLLSFLVGSVIGIAIYVLGSAFAYLASPIIGAYLAIYTLVDAMGSIPTDVGPIKLIQALFQDWGDSIALVVRALKVDVPLAWEITKTAAQIAILQMKEAWPPIWEFIKEGFSISARTIKATIGEVFDYIQGRAVISANLWSMGISEEEAQQQIRQLDKIYTSRMKVIADTAKREFSQAAANFKVPETTPEIEKLKNNLKEMEEALAFEEFIQDWVGYEDAATDSITNVQKAMEKAAADMAKATGEGIIVPTKKATNEMQSLNSAILGTADSATRMQQYISLFADALQQGRTIKPVELGGITRPLEEGFIETAVNQSKKADEMQQEADDFYNQMFAGPSEYNIKPELNQGPQDYESLFDVRQEEHDTETLFNSAVELWREAVEILRSIQTSSSDTAENTQVFEAIEGADL